MIRRLLPLIVSAVLLAACADDGTPGERISLEPTPSSPDDHAADGGRADAPGADGTAPDDAGTIVLEEIPEVTGEGPDGYREALTINFEHDPDNIALIGGGATCVAEAWIDDLGTEPFEAAGITPQMLAEQQSMEAFRQLDLDLERSRQLLGHLPDCGIDVVAIVLDSPIYESADPATDACLAEGLTEPIVLDSLALALASDPDPDEAATLQAPLLGVLSDCEAGMAD